MQRKARIKRHLSIRKHLLGLKMRPRLSVFRSNKHIYAQIIDDLEGKTLVSASDDKMNKIKKSDKAYEVGRKIAEKALRKKIKDVVFDRGGFLYHGRVLEVARGAREGGLKL